MVMPKNFPRLCTDNFRTPSSKTLATGLICLCGLVEELERASNRYMCIVKELSVMNSVQKIISAGQ